MRDWIVGLQKGAKDRGEGLDPQEWIPLQEAAGIPVPPELKDLYEAMNAAAFEGEVTLAPFRGGTEAGVLELSRQTASGLPSRGTWIFGHQGGRHPLFATMASALREDAIPGRPEWIQELRDDDWVFGIQRENDTRFYRSLEQLLARLVPPVQTEEFGDVTYARALTAVQGALDGLEEEGEENDDSPAPAARARPAARKAPARKAKGSSGSKKASAKAKPARKAKVKAKAKSKAKAKPAKRGKAMAARTKAKSARRARPAARKTKARAKRPAARKKRR